MIIQTITYTDYNDLERTEDFCFHLTKTEMTELDLSRMGGYDVYLKRLANAKDLPKLADVFKTMILKAYGEKSEDGRSFMKSKEISDRFYHSAAYDVLFQDLILGKIDAFDFFIGVMPKDIQDAAKKKLAENPKLREGKIEA